MTERFATQAASGTRLWNMHWNVRWDMLGVSGIGNGLRRFDGFRANKSTLGQD